MHIRIKDNNLPKSILKEISVITDGALLHFREVDYDKESRLLYLPFERYEIKEEARFLGLMKSRRCDRNVKIKSSMIIRNVTDCRIENRISDPEVSTIFILFGVKIEGSDIYLCSVEEARGEICFSIELKVNEIDIEINDELN